MMGSGENLKIKDAPMSTRETARVPSLMDGERIVFTEESNPQSYLKLIASGDVDETMLEALEDYVKGQKKRLERDAGKGEAAN
jgi:hypothetical protein